MTCSIIHSCAVILDILPISKNRYFHSNSHEDVSEKNWDTFRNRSAYSYCILTEKKSNPAKGKLMGNAKYEIT